MRLKVASEDVGDLDFSDWIARLRDEPGADTTPRDAAAGPAGAGAGPQDTAESGGDVAAEPVDDTAAERADDAAEPEDDVASRSAGVADDGPEDVAGDVAAADRGDYAAATPGEYARARPGGRVALIARRARVRDDMRAVIGNEIRMPAVWCELAPCISRYSDPVALGEADVRARAVSAGWRADRFGRLTCPQCQQSSALFWSAQPVALWDKETAMIMVTLMADGRRESRVDNDADAPEMPFMRPVHAPITPLGRHEIRGRHRKHSRRSADIPDAQDIAVMPIADD